MHLKHIGATHLGKGREMGEGRREGGREEWAGEEAGWGRGGRMEDGRKAEFDGKRGGKGRGGKARRNKFLNYFKEKKFWGNSSQGDGFSAGRQVFSGRPHPGTQRGGSGMVQVLLQAIRL